MTFTRVSMRKIREIFRLYLQAGLKYRQIARSCSTTHATVGKYSRSPNRPGWAGRCRRSWQTTRRLSPGCSPTRFLHRAVPAGRSQLRQRFEQAWCNPVLRDEGRDGLPQEL